MTPEERKIKNDFICNLIDLLTNDSNNDDMYFKKLLWANEEIASCLISFEKQYSCYEELKQLL